LSLILSFAACRYRRVLFFVVLVCLCLLKLSIIEGNRKELTSFFLSHGDCDALAGRGNIWDYLGPKIADRLWFGYGFNVFEMYYKFEHPNILNPMSPQWGEPIPSHPHNAYLEVLFSGGIITLLPFLAWTGLMLWRWYTRQEMLRDLLVLWLLFGSMTEITLAGPPSLETLLCFVVLGMDRRRVTDDAN
jgi:O-antigen ligase